MELVIADLNRMLLGLQMPDEAMNTQMNADVAPIVGKITIVKDQIASGEVSTEAIKASLASIANEFEAIETIHPMKENVIYDLRRFVESL
jgi:hypothetical protein